MTTMALVGVELNLGTKIVTVHEGDILGNIHYQSGQEEKIVSGRVRVVEATVRDNSRNVNDCPPEPYLYKYIIPTYLVIDCSDEFDADFERVQISKIIDIEEVNGSNEMNDQVDQIIEDIGGTEVSDNVYNIVTSTGLLSDTGMFEQILAINRVSSISVTCGAETRTYSKDDADLEEFKTFVDGFIPKKNSDPEITLSMDVVYE